MHSYVELHNCRSNNNKFRRQCQIRSSSGRSGRQPRLPPHLQTPQGGRRPLQHHGRDKLRLLVPECHVQRGEVLERLEVCIRPLQARCPRQAQPL